MARLKTPKISAGDRFGSLVVAGDPFRRLVKDGSYSLWAVPCRCDCGKTSDVDWGNLKSGNSTSCPCSRGRNAGVALSRRLRTHGEGHSRLYHVWNAMRRRCSNPADLGYHRYGGRGITVITQWESYEIFRDWANSSGYAPGLTIDRKDVEGGYSPENCTWATRKEQAHNTRRNRRIDAFGESKLLCDWVCDPRCKVGHSVVHYRLAQGWSAEFAIGSPPGKYRRNRDQVHPSQS